jgi:hypothetical protein
MRHLFGLATLLVLLLSSGCFGRKSPAPVQTSRPSVVGTNAAAGDKLIVTPAEGLNGKVSRVNTTLRFVVITFPIGQMAEINQRLYIYRHGLKVGEATVTGPQREDSIVADITAGDSEVGDEVRDR